MSQPPNPERPTGHPGQHREHHPAQPGRKQHTANGPPPGPHHPTPGTAEATTNHATVTPAATGTTPPTQLNGAPTPGTAANSGKAGSSDPGAAEDNGPATCPAPRTTPGPSPYAAPHTAAFGTSARHSSSTAKRPDHTSVS